MEKMLAIYKLNDPKKALASSESLAQAGSPKVSAVVKLFFCGHCATTLLLVFKGTKAGKLAAVSLKKISRKCVPKELLHMG